MLPLVHVPEEVGWSFTRRPLITTASAWFDDPSMVDGGALEIEEARRHVVRRYLGAFGPASTADLSAWTGLPASDFRAAIAALDNEGSLVRFRDEAGRELLDLADAPRPGEDAAAPPRLLPMWDEILLGFRDRTRVISDEDRARVISRNGDVLPTFLVDGRVAGFWWAEPDGAGTRVVLEPFVGLPPPTGARSRPRPTGWPVSSGPWSLRSMPAIGRREHAGTSRDGLSRLRQSRRGRDTSRRRGWTAGSAIGSAW